MFLQENCVYETVVLPLDEETFEKTVTPIVQEYFEHGDANEVAVRFMTVLLNEETAFALFISNRCHAVLCNYFYE